MRPAKRWLMVFIAAVIGGGLAGIVQLATTEVAVAPEPLGLGEGARSRARVARQDRSVLSDAARPGLSGDDRARVSAHVESSAEVDRNGRVSLDVLPTAHLRVSRAAEAGLGESAAKRLWVGGDTRAALGEGVALGFVRRTNPALHAGARSRPKPRVRSGFGFREQVGWRLQASDSKLYLQAGHTGYGETGRGGAQAQLVLSIVNVGEDTVHEVRVQGQLHPWAEMTMPRVDKEACRLGDGRIRCNLGDLPPMGEARIVLDSGRPASSPLAEIRVTSASPPRESIPPADAPTSTSSSTDAQPTPALARSSDATPPDASRRAESGKGARRTGAMPNREESARAESHPEVEHALRSPALPLEPTGPRRRWAGFGLMAGLLAGLGLQWGVRRGVITRRDPFGSPLRVDLRKALASRGRIDSSSRH